MSYSVSNERWKAMYYKKQLSTVIYVYFTIIISKTLYEPQVFDKQGMSTICCNLLQSLPLWEQSVSNGLNTW